MSGKVIKEPRIKSKLICTPSWTNSSCDCGNTLLDNF
ncbi:unnamed protein product [Nezara viridula]|uniref:Uncharacterized protein n=1 Tax=Nezara viridula TaxID=85310 RepID=A0A9P0MDP3_NEZVI|nr:unnamed protein product [Nezara viridula]